MDAVIAAAAWILPEGCGAWGAGGGPSAAGSGELLSGGELVAGPVPNLGRFPQATRDACAACGLALRAGEVGEARPVGIVAAGFDGTLAANREYLRDYVENGRVTGRGNLFIYTTPVSAIAEASILFGLQGPLLWLEAAETPAAELLEAAGEMAASGQAAAMIALWQDEAATLAALVAGNEEPPGAPLAEVLRDARRWQDPSEGARDFREEGRP